MKRKITPAAVIRFTCLVTCLVTCLYTGIFTCLSYGNSNRGESPFDLSHVKGTLDEQVNIDYPPYYDLREYNRVTPVKLREGFAYNEYSIYGALESYLAPGEIRNFYELGLKESHREGFDLYGYRPSNLQMNVARLVSWVAPMDHPNDGYTYQSVGDWFTVQKHIQQVVFIPERTSPTDLNTIKWFIMNHGAVYGRMYSFFDLFFDEDHSSYYQFGHFGGDDEPAIYAGAVVGWDDGFNRENFKEPPPGDGAFIVKFYFGVDFGDNGYIYISYYDSELKINASFNNAESPINYGTIYQYDPLGSTSTAGNGTPVYWGANVFTANDHAPLEAVSFYTNDALANCEVYIYKNLSTHTGRSPIDGTPAAVKTGFFTYPGYYTVKLDSPVPLEQGEAFSVVIKFKNSAYTSPVAIEYPVPEHSSGARANPGESYISADGRSWKDLTLTHPESNVCIKAFTSFIPPFPIPVINLDVSPVWQNVWLIGKTYGYVTFRIENLADVPVREIVLYRKVNDQLYRKLKTFSPDENENGVYSHVETNIIRGDLYTFHVAVFTAEDRITVKSNEGSIKIE